MDAFSEVLSGVRLNGAMFFSAEFSAPWRLSTPHCRVLAATLAPGASAGVNARQWGVERRHGAENVALKNSAPFKRTPLKTSENASIVPWTPGKVS